MPYTVPLSEQEQAAALWTYVQSKLPRFTSKDALEVVQRVRPHPHEAVKALSTRLRKELAEKGVVVKHASALEAAARLRGFSSWHDANRAMPDAKLTLTSILPSIREELFAGWRELAPRICKLADVWLLQRPVRAIQLQFGLELPPVS